MKKKLFFLTIVCNLFAAPLLHAELEFLRLDLQRQKQVHQILNEAPCTCGCNMTVGQCLIEDQSCPVSPGIAKDIIARYSNVATGSQSSPAAAADTRGFRTDNGKWHNRLAGKLLVYMKTTSVSRIKECTWLYSDGTLAVNTNGGTFSGGGSVSISGANQGGGDGQCGTTGEVVTFQYNNGELQQYKLSYGQDGFLYLNTYRHFLLDHNDPTCR